MSNSLSLKYNQNQNTLDKDSSEVLPTEKEKEEDLISDSNYSDDSIANNTQCIINKCVNLGAKRIAIRDDSEKHSQYFVCDRHYHELMTGYVALKKDNSSAAWQSV